MIIQFILKHWKKVFDILLVIVIAIAAYYFFTKFIFGTRTKLHNTSNMISSIRDIGELVTAEYYGEVIASLEETELDLLELDSVDINAFLWYKSIKNRVFDIYEEDQRRIAPRSKLKNLAQTFRNEHSQVANYDKFLTFIGSELSIGKFKDREIEDNLFDIMLFLYREIRKKYIKLSENEFNTYLSEDANTKILFSRYLKVEKKKKLGNRELSIIGRGWVQAGFDFEKITENNFYYNKDQKVIHLLGFEPKILDADINPWFIPENKIPGYDILATKGNVNFKDAQKVKLKCVDKLKHKAVEADILTRATENGEETLMAFFSLLVKDEIKKVVFHSDSMNQLYDIVAKDTLISYDEVNLIRKGINKSIEAIKAAKSEPAKNAGLIKRKEALLIQFIDKLKELPYGEKSLKCKFNYYFAITNDIIKSKTILIDNTDQIAEIKDSAWRDDAKILDKIRVDLFSVDTTAGRDTVLFIDPMEQYHDLSYWFGNGPSFINEYNEFLAVYYNRVEFVKTRKDDENYRADPKNTVITTLSINDKNVVLYYSTDTLQDNKETLYRAFPLKFYACTFDKDKMNKFIKEEDPGDALAYVDTLNCYSILKNYQVDNKIDWRDVNNYQSNNNTEETTALANYCKLKRTIYQENKRQKFMDRMGDISQKLNNFNDTVNTKVNRFTGKLRD